MFPRNCRPFLRICCRTAPIMSISTDSKAATSLSSAAEHRQRSLRHCFMKRAPTSEWSQESRPSCSIRACSLHALSPKQFAGRSPRSGPDGSLDFFTDLPHIFYHLPKPVQNRLVKGFLGPAGGWFLRGRFDKVPLLAGYQIKGAEASSGRAVLWLRSGNGDERRIETEHVIAATGYRADIRRLPFLSAGIASQLKLFDNVPELSSHFELSVPGLFFVGAAAVDSFGPAIRFACGAKFAAGRLSNYLARTSRFTSRGTALGAPQRAHSARP